MNAHTRGLPPERYAACSADLLERSRVVINDSRALKADIRISAFEARSLLESRHQWLTDQSALRYVARDATP